MRGLGGWKWPGNTNTQIRFENYSIICKGGGVLIGSNDSAASISLLFLRCFFLVVTDKIADPLEKKFFLDPFSG